MKNRKWKPAWLGMLLLVIMMNSICMAEEYEDDPIPEAAGTVLYDDAGAAYIVSNADYGNACVSYKAPPKDASGEIIIPDAVEIGHVTYRVDMIEDMAFRKNKKITSVKLGSNVERIWPRAFSLCTSLKKVVLNDKLEMIDDMAFYGCKKLKSITIPAKVWSIGQGAFQKCKKLKKITIKTKLLKKSDFGEDAFAGIYKKATVKCPKGKKKAYKKLFRKFGAKKTVKFK